MKAIVQERYGSPDDLELREVAEPEVGEDEVLVRVRAASLHPDNVTFEQAASLPTSGFIALQNLRGVNQWRPGKKVLINGAGADEVVDYTREDFTRRGVRYHADH